MTIRLNSHASKSLMTLMVWRHLPHLVHIQIPPGLVHRILTLAHRALFVSRPLKLPHPKGMLVMSTFIQCRIVIFNCPSKAGYTKAQFWVENLIFFPWRIQPCYQSLQNIAGNLQALIHCVIFHSTYCSLLETLPHEYGPDLSDQEAEADDMQIALFESIQNSSAEMDRWVAELSESLIYITQ